MIRKTARVGNPPKSDQMWGTLRFIVECHPLFGWRRTGFEINTKGEGTVSRRVRHDALERHSVQRRFEIGGEANSFSARRALPHVLAANLFLHHAARVLARGCRGS